ncbi:hypothetical protein [Nesterenkonia alkaliphila]
MRCRVLAGQAGGHDNNSDRHTADQDLWHHHRARCREPENPPRGVGGHHGPLGFGQDPAENPYWTERAALVFKDPDRWSVVLAPWVFGAAPD